MTKNILHIMAMLLAVCIGIGGADLTGIIDLIPKDIAGKLVLIPAGSMIIGHALLSIGDLMDDGQKNDSFPGSLKLHPATVLFAVVLNGIAGWYSPYLGICGLGIFALAIFIHGAFRHVGLLSLIALSCCLFFTSCVSTTSPDGTRTTTADPVAIEHTTTLGLSVLDRIVSAFKKTDAAPAATPVVGTK